MAELSLPLLQLICQATGARAVRHSAVIQSLWRGYGEILRVMLDDAPMSTVVVKHIRLPRRLASDLGHARKQQSYQVELNWYQDWSPRCDSTCRVPRCLAVAVQEQDTILVLEDLAEAGLSLTPARLNRQQIQLGLSWLAHFHARFVQQTPAGLWPIGSYWHLATRSEELAAMPSGPLKAAAAELDQRLRQCPFQTLIHGDAKRANMCFAPHGQSMAMVDFQYVGGGCGIQDVAYFLDSCLTEAELPDQHQAWLEVYFRHLHQALGDSPVDAQALESAWRSLFAVAWTDFYRFMQGWMPGYHSDFSEKLAKQVIT